MIQSSAPIFVHSGDGRDLLVTKLQKARYSAIRA